jgi:hypothetical protein
MSEPMEGLGLDLRNDFDDKVPRVRDVDIGMQLGMAQPENIRHTIAKYAEDLSDFGVLTQRVKTPGKLGGRTAKEYWLNRDQAIFVAGRSDTELGRKTYKLLVKAFSAFERLLIERLPPFLRAEFSEWNKVWRDELMAELCKLRGELFTGRHPRWCARMNSIIYECVLGKELYAELKARNPKPAKGHNHHQLIDKAYREAFDKQLGSVRLLAESSCSITDLEDRLRLVYQKRPMQLPLWAARSRPAPKLAKTGPKPKAPLRLAASSSDDEPA